MTSACVIYDLSLKSGHQFVPKVLDTGFECIPITRLPVGTASRNRILASESQEEHIVRTMTIVTVDVIIGETHLTERDGRLASGVSTISISPDTIDLKLLARSDYLNWCWRSVTYHLIVAEDSHDTERLHSILLGVEICVSKNNIGMDVGVQIRNAVLAQLILECSLILPSFIGTTVAPFVIQAIAVNIHVIILTTVCLTMEIDGTADVATVRKAVRGTVDSISEPPRKLVVAFSSLKGVSLEIL